MSVNHDAGLSCIQWRASSCQGMLPVTMPARIGSIQAVLAHRAVTAGVYLIWIKVKQIMCTACVSERSLCGDDDVTSISRTPTIIGAFFVCNLLTQSRAKKRLSFPFCLVSFR